ncbi:hypothetical protein Klosneuvirus_15_9 [Klosneuvirus KNV1]|uniref:Uncharacterized protein n=1 Tax=Klosneuvirus KNV1 TaxID=1977640 RepID=A0A1V0SM24_9VIRU|nr:hypothetical protein Klosneuvirus_15_9 [Klosneuvirus KNV1]
MDTIDVSEGSQYFVANQQGVNKMVKPDELFQTIDQYMKSFDPRKIIITMYKRTEREVKIIGDTKYFYYLTRNEPNAKFVMEFYDAIYSEFRYDQKTNQWISNNGKSVLSIKPAATNFESYINQKEIDDVTDTLKSMSLSKSKDTNDVVDLTNKFNSMTLEVQQ